MHLHTYGYISSLCCDDIIARAWQQKVLCYLCTKLMQIMLYVTINKDKTVNYYASIMHRYALLISSLNRYRTFTVCNKAANSV